MNKNRVKLTNLCTIAFISLILQSCASTKSENLELNTASNAKANTSQYYIYLAGPEVFLPDPVEAGVKKKAAIEKLNKENLSLIHI